MTKTQLLDVLIANGLGVAQALAELNHIISEAKAKPPGTVVTYYMRHTGSPIVIITTHQPAR